jgi:ribosomal protein L40E
MVSQYFIINDMNHLPICSDCGADFPPTKSSCPNCGATSRTLRIDVSDTITFRGSLTLESIREFYENHPWVIAVVIAITVVSSLLGLLLTGMIGVFAGLALGALSYVLGPRAVIKVREITRIHSN